MVEKMQTTRKIKEMEEIGKDVDKVIKDLEISLEEMNKIEKENEKIKHRICKVRTRPAPSISKIKELDISAQLGEIDELMKQIALNEIPFMLEEEDLRLLEMKEKEKLKIKRKLVPKQFGNRLAEVNKELKKGIQASN